MYLGMVFEVLTVYTPSFRPFQKGVSSYPKLKTKYNYRVYRSKFFYTKLQENMNYKYLCALALSCSFGLNNLAAQNEDIHSAKLFISYENSEISGQNEKIVLAGEEAYRFDVADFLTKNKHDNVRVSGWATVDNERLTYKYNSNNTSEDEESGRYNEVVTSVEKGPFLGISLVGTDDFTGARITKIIEGSPAEAYGFQIGDVITLIGNDEISTACDVTQSISQSEPGSLLDIDLVRDNENENVELALGYRLHKKISWLPTAEQIVLDNATTNNSQSADLAVFPNPTEGVLQVQYTATQQGAVQMNLTDLTGKVILAKEIDAFSGVLTDVLDLKTLPDGVYFLNVVQGNEAKTEKIILQKS